MPKGKILCIEGTDCSGKETQSKILFRRLSSGGARVRSMSFPQYFTPTGRIVGEAYLGKSPKEMGYDVLDKQGSWFGDADNVDSKIASLYFAADRLAARDGMLRNLNEMDLILDRYIGSNMAHQGGKLRSPEEREALYSQLEELEFGFCGMPKPDLTIFLHMPLERSIELRRKRDGGKDVIPDGHEGNPEHLKRAENAYLELARRNKWKTLECEIEGELRSPEEISEEVYGLAKKILVF